MANGASEPKLYLSSLDPGIGKTQTILAFLHALLSSPHHREVGVLACFGRLEEVNRFAVSLAERIGAESIHVATSDHEVNACGRCLEAEAAPVVITTQQHLEWVWLGRCSSSPDLSQYRGQPRRVKLWDETFLPGLPLTVARDDVASLIRPIRPVSPALADTLDALFCRLGSEPDRAIFAMPDLTAGGVRMEDVLTSLPEDLQAIFHALWLLSGKRVGVRKDGVRGQTCLHYHVTYPPDWSPMLILDASGRVRKTYAALSDRRRVMVQLPSPPKHYGPLTVHVWDKAGGKNAWTKDAASLIDGIADMVRTRPDERWLIVAHKPGWKMPDVENRVRAKLTGVVPDKNVSFTTWGRHMATNEYADCGNVILAGTLFYRPPQYEALHRLVSEYPPDAGDVATADINAIRDGENQHLILQALCRGRVRKSDGEQCGAMNAYIIAAKNTGICDALPEIFPGCRVVAWKPKQTPTGPAAQVLAVVKAWMNDPQKRGQPLPFKLIARSLGMDASRFRWQVRQNPMFRDALSALGVQEAGPPGGKRKTYFASIPAT